MEIRLLKKHEIDLAKELIYMTFHECVIANCCEKEISDFYNFNQIENFHRLIEEGHLVALGVLDDENLIAVALLMDYQFLKAIYVKKGYQRQGIGTQLLNKVKNLVCEDLIVYPHEKVTHFFYKNGFKKDSQHSEPSLVYCSIHTHQFENYDQVHHFISQQKKRVYALDHFKKFMNDLCQPQTLLKAIHIGGTNGKGSTTNYIRSVLQKAGYKVATFTSPVLVTRLEIMRINDCYIQEEEIIKYANRYMSLWLEYELSMFEIEVFIAIMFFLKHRVNYAIFEVGLGGELDATNIIMPMIAANTNIGLDHVEYLGNTYEQIAFTKGGIIKKQTPFITGEKKQVCLDVFKALCQKQQSPFLQVPPVSHICEHMDSISYQYANYQIELNTSAMYQVENSSLAISILLYLKANGYVYFTDEDLLSGIKEAVWAGRFEIMHHDPLIIIDGAHNKEGVEAFFHSAKKYKDIKIIFSALKDKDTHHMLEKLLELTDDVTVCEFDFYRAQSAEKLAENFPVKIEKDWKIAVDTALSQEKNVFITGSLYFISQVRAYLLSKKYNL